MRGNYFGKHFCEGSRVRGLFDGIEESKTNVCSFPYLARELTVIDWCQPRVRAMKRRGITRGNERRIKYSKFRAQRNTPTGNDEPDDGRLYDRKKSTAEGGSNGEQAVPKPTFANDRRVFERGRDRTVCWRQNS